MLWEICRSAGYGFWMVEWSGDSLGRPHFMGNQELTIYYIWDQDLLKGTQRQFLSRRIKNTFYAIQSNFRSLGKRSSQRYKIYICWVILG